MNIKTKVELSYSSKISSPSLCGMIKPKILIPVSVAANVCDEEFKYIIMHELTHLKNKDIFINWVITLLSIIYWFNPILLYGFHKMRQDCEFSCDGQAISYLDEGKNIQYGNAIIRVLELAGNSNRLIGTTSMVMKNSEIKRRIIMISKYKRVNIKNILLGTLIVVIIGGMGIAINTSKLQTETPTAIAKKFSKNLYTADSQKVSDYVKYMKYMEKAIPKTSKEGAVMAPNAEGIKLMQAFDKNISTLMTKDAYEGIVANRFNTLSSELCSKGNYTVLVTDFILDKNLYGVKEDKAGYNYEAKLKFTSTNGKAEQIATVKGYIGFLKENGKWKVSIHKMNEPYLNSISLGIALNTSKSQVKTPVSIAEEFGRNLYTVVSEKLLEYKKYYNAFAAIGVKANLLSESGQTQTQMMKSLDKKIQPLMTEEAYYALMSSRMNTLILNSVLRAISPCK